MKATITVITEAAEQYRAAMAAYEAIPFDFGSALSHPDAPIETPEARAGAMIAQMGLTRALVRCVGMGLDGTFDDDRSGNFWRMVATYIMGVASEAQDAR